MKVHEYQAKGIFASYGVPVDNSILCKTPQEAVEAFKKLGTERCVVKAQVHTGGRGKAGGVKLACNEAEVLQHTTSILEMDIKGSTFAGLSTFLISSSGSSLHSMMSIFSLFNSSTTF